MAAETALAVGADIRTSSESRLVSRLVYGQRLPFWHRASPGPMSRNPGADAPQLPATQGTGSARIRPARGVTARTAPVARRVHVRPDSCRFHPSSHQTFIRKTNTLERTTYRKEHLVLMGTCVRSAAQRNRPTSAALVTGRSRFKKTPTSKLRMLRLCAQVANAWVCAASTNANTLKSFGRLQRQSVSAGMVPLSRCRQALRLEKPRTPSEPTDGVVLVR